MLLSGMDGVFWQVSKAAYYATLWSFLGEHGLVWLLVSVVFDMHLGLKDGGYLIRRAAQVSIVF